MSAELDGRLTPQREAVLAIVREARDHPTAADVYDRVRRLHPTIAYATVYNALSFLVKNGLVRELKLGAGDACRYDGRLEPHMHVVCTRCSTVGEADVYLPVELLNSLQASTRFTLSGQPIQLFGLCPTCSQATADSAAH